MVPGGIVEQLLAYEPRKGAVHAPSVPNDVGLVLHVAAFSVGRGLFVAPCEWVSTECSLMFCVESMCERRGRRFVSSHCLRG
jgi:hypothetical protein